MSEPEDLIEKWRGIVEHETLPRSGLTPEGHIYKECADQLEEVIQNE